MSQLISPWAVRAASTLGLTASAALVGGGLALSLGTIPTITLSPDSLLRRQWRQTYDLGFTLGPPASLLGCLCLTYAAWAEHAVAPRSTTWVGLGVVAAGTLSVIPFTWAFIVPVNTVLLAETDVGRNGEGKGKRGDGAGAGSDEDGLSEAELKALVQKWGKLNGFRCLIPALASLGGLWLVL